MNYPSFDQPGPYSNNVSYPELPLYPGPPQMGVGPDIMPPMPMMGNMPVMNAGETICQFCGRKTLNMTRRSCGCTAITWGVGIFICFFPLFWLPCCIDSMRDLQFVCTNCGNVKSTVPASCC